MDQITYGDLIGYFLTFVFGIISGSFGTKIIQNRRKTITQNNNVVNGDIVGGNKNDK